MAEGNPRSIRHVLDVVVRLLGGEDGKKFRAAEEQVAEAYRVAAQDTSSDGAAAAAAYEPKSGSRRRTAWHWEDIISTFACKSGRL